MNMFPLSRIIYMPISPSTTLLGPISTDFSSSPAIPLYNPALLNNPFNLSSTTNFEQNIRQTHRFKRIHDDFHDIQQKKRPKLTSAISKNALMLLHDLKPSIEYKLIAQTGPSHRPIFTMAVEINGQIFEGIAQTKKEAKQAAAEKALQAFSEQSFLLSNNLAESHEIQNDSNQLKEANTLIENDFSDRISICIQEKFNQLTQNDIRLQRRKVLSGIVMTHNYNLETMEIICITTGTKSIHSDEKIINGQVLNDCHAEIIARRCLIRYCYEQLQLILDDKFDQSIFERIQNSDRFQIKSSIHFHLYISTVPCGDSRIFSSINLNQNLKYSLKKSRGLLRRKIEVGEGTIPILAKNIYQNIQLWDNKRLLTMSCSDKLCRWNFIGLQGALLSILIDPIYYTSIIIGSLYHNEHIQRALFSRIEQKINHIPIPYGLRRPFISGISNPEIRNTIRAPHHALIWNCIDKKCEIIDTSTGLTISHESSMVSKAALFRLWRNLMNKIKSKAIPMIYYDAKQLAVDYQTAKMEVNKAFENSGFGQWIKKSPEQDLISLTNELIPSVD